MASEETLNILRLYPARLLQEGIAVKGLVLYGSHVRGEEHSDSDIDVLVLLEDDLTPKEINALWTRLEHLTIGIDTRIETWPVTVSRYETDDVSPLILIARREGIPIAA